MKPIKIKPTIIIAILKLNPKSGFNIPVKKMKSLVASVMYEATYPFHGDDRAWM